MTSSTPTKTPLTALRDDLSRYRRNAQAKFMRLQREASDKVLADAAKSGVSKAFSDATDDGSLAVDTETHRYYINLIKRIDEIAEVFDIKLNTTPPSSLDLPPRS